MASDPLRGVRARRATAPSGGGRPPRARPSRTTGTSDPLAARAAELHAKAREADAVAARDRAARAEINDRLRADGSGRWSYTALARALGCSRELIAQLVRRRR